VTRRERHENLTGANMSVLNGLTINSSGMGNDAKTIKSLTEYAGKTDSRGYCTSLTRWC